MSRRGSKRNESTRESQTHRFHRENFADSRTTQKLRTHRVIEDLLGALMHVLALLRTYQQVDWYHTGARPQELLDQQLAHEAGTTSEEDALAIVKLLDRRELLVDQRRTLRRRAFRWRTFRRRFRYAVRFDDGHFLAIDSVQQHFHHLCDRWHLQRKHSLSIAQCAYRCFNLRAIRIRNRARYESLRRI